MAHFTLYEIAETITDESARRGDVATSEASDPEPVTFREALEALRGGVWDNLDARASEVIAYPADWRQDFRTGEYAAETLVIRADDPRNLERLLAAFEA